MPDALAAGDGYVDDAVQALQSAPVFVSREVADASALAGRLTAQVGDASVGIAVFSDNAALEASGPEIVTELASRTGYDTIIVAVGDDLSAGSRVLPSGEAMRIANEAEGSAGSLPAALTETVQTVIAESASAPEDAQGVPAGVVIAVVVAVLAVAAAVTTIVVRLRARSRRAATPATGELPVGVRASLETLRAVRGQYAAVAASGNPAAARAAAETAGDIDAIVENAPELFARLDRRGGESQRTLAEVEYGDKLAKLTAALDRDYLLDILTHPHLWDDPDERIAEVREASTAVSHELVENIRQVNARRALHFQVSLDSLVGGRKELRDWEREFRQATDGGRPASDP